MLRRQCLRLALFFQMQWPFILVGLGIVFSLWLAFFLIEPAPPKHLVLAAGPKGGGYDYFAHRYAEAFAKEGITLEIRETEGSIENLQLLNDPTSGVDVAFAQSGVGWMAGVFTEVPEEARIYSLAKLYFEPLWIFTQRGKGFTALRDLKGKRLAVGMPGSGVEALSVDLLKWSGVDATNSTLIKLPTDASMEALKAGQVDAAFFVAAGGSPTHQKWACDPTLQLHSFTDANAWLRRFGFLTKVVFPQSVLDFARGLPAQDVVLLAPATVLVTHDDLHPALAYLFLETARQLHGKHRILADAGQFPNAENLEFPLHHESERYFLHGPSLLQRYLPYHWAVLIDRSKFLVLPLLTLLIPLGRIAFPTYQWSVRRNIWKWYKMVHAIERDYRRGEIPHTDLLERIQQLETQTASVHVPLAYASELYTLRHHLVMIRKRIGRGE